MKNDGNIIFSAKDYAKIMNKYFTEHYYCKGILGVDLGSKLGIPQRIGIILRGLLTGKRSPAHKNQIEVKFPEIREYLESILPIKYENWHFEVGKDGILAKALFICERGPEKGYVTLSVQEIFFGNQFHTGGEVRKVGAITF